MYTTLLLAVTLLAPPAPGSPSSAPAAPASPRLPGSKKVDPEVVTFTTEDDLTITADYFEPRNKKTRAPSAIMIHDAGADRSQMTLFAERLNAQGLAVLVPDLRGHGASATESIDWNKLNEKDRVRLWSFAPRDLQAASAWLEKRKEVNASNVTLAGLRAGSSLAVYHAGRDEKVRAVVLIEPAAEPTLGFDLRREIAQLAGLTTKVYTPREKQGDAKTIQLDATKANGGLQFVEIDLCKSKGEDLIHDRRVASDVAKWVEERVFPKRGRR